MKLLYVDTIRCDTVHIIRERPCITSWSMDLLRRRESIQLSTGCFEIGNVAETLVDEQHEDRPRENEEIDIKRYLDEVEHTFNMLKTLMSDFDRILKKGRTRYPTSVEFDVWEKKLIDLVMPDFSLGLTQEFEEVVDSKENAPNKEDDNVVPNGQYAPRHIFESMVDDTFIFRGVIDIWETMLNKNEQYRSKSSPRRLFCDTTTMAAMKNDKELATLRNVDMIFFPIRRQSHFYLIVFNQKNPGLLIIDNTKTEVDIGNKYGELAAQLHKALNDYMKSVRLPKEKIMANVTANVCNLKWSTVRNGVDCIIFVMRHMEHYMGQVINRWDCGFFQEGCGQEQQLRRLRRKYLTKILLSNDNILKDALYKQALEFDELDDNLKESILTSVFNKREMRFGKE
ncbi:hypothetical protein Ccrd_024803 [Cynara cardunculus var. scolymus]|uniref:Peptidase C48, SUMO/Sentrin/Ubl1 n=1 Tax=Cynara cardunculus var. scolymus TaxID=59895 RepID=A0A103XBZ1_CYNCS|nr:hypothetical protein Ccrd_024803 [Cynara cardunculus var. scolymus]